MAKESANAVNKNAIIVIAVIAVIIIVAIIFAIVGSNSNSVNHSSTESSTAEKTGNDRIDKILAKIDAQQKVVDKLNAELTPLVNQRTELEEKIIALTSNGQSTSEPSVESNAETSEENAVDTVE